MHVLCIILLVEFSEFLFIYSYDVSRIAMCNCV